MDIDYQKLGFRCGLEIHQQLSGKKLFCNCPAINSDKEPDVKVVRKLRAVAGETGRVDSAAEYEMTKKKEFIYISNSEDTCNVEYDDEPPHPANKDALETALMISRMMNAKIVDDIQFMRKTVVDGSNTSGFQRTALVAQNGYVETSLGNVRVPTICLEEEAAQRIEENDKTLTYKLDRLGIALIEIGTSADIKNPEHAKETASKLGMILRSTERVKRGLGTIRQDVNISIEKGARTEIKGFQDLKAIPKVIENEVNRQLELIRQGKKIKEEVRKAEADFSTSFLRPMPGADRMYPETDIETIKVTKDMIKKIKLPELISDRAEKLIEKYTVNEVSANEIVKNKLDFEEYANKFKNIEPQTIANVLINIPKDIKTRFNLESSKLKKDDFIEVLGYLNEGKISKEAVIDLLIKKIKCEKIDLSQFKTVSLDEVESEIKKIIKEKPGLNIGGYMGLVMAKYRGKADGKTISELIKKNIGK